MIRWRPFADFAELRHRIDSALEDMLSDEDGKWGPAIDLVEEDGKLVFRADLPSLKPEEVKVEVEGDIPTISGEHEETREEKEKRYTRRERRYGAFSRSIRLPAAISPDQIEATSSEGVGRSRSPSPPIPRPRR